MAESSKHVENRAAAVPRLPTLTGARFIAAVFVFVFHSLLQGFFANRGLSNDLESVFWMGGWTAVTFFFVLSGFVLTWAMRSTDTVRGFYRRRVLKILPNHLITAVVALLLLVFVTSRTVVGAGIPKPSTVVMNLLLVQSWSPDWAVRVSLDPPAWSLSCEAAFYVAFPLLFLLVRRIRPERLWAWAGAVAVVAVIVVPVAAAQLPHDSVIQGLGLSFPQFWFVLQFPPVRALEFVLGMLLARIVMTRRRLPITFGGAVAVTVAAYAVAPLFPAVFRSNAVMIAPLGLLVAASAVADVRQQRSWLASKLMVKLGDITFAFYLWHQLVLMYGGYWLGNRSFSTPVAIGVEVLLFAVALGLAYLLFTFVENPIMRAWSRPRRARRLVPVTAPPGPDEFRRAS